MHALNKTNPTIAYHNVLSNGNKKAFEGIAFGCRNTNKILKEISSNIKLSYAFCANNNTEHGMNAWYVQPVRIDRSPI